MTKYIKIFCSRLCIAYILTLMIVAASLFFYTTESRASSPASQNYNYSITSQNAYPSFTPGSSYNFTISVRNTGSATWQKNQVNLGTSRGQDRVPGFIREGDGPSGWISPNRIAFQESSVAPGGTATYSFWMKAPSSMPAGTYREYFQVVADGAEWMFDYGIYWDVRVVTGIDSYQYTISSQNAYPTLYANQSYNFVITVVNTGYVTWQKNQVNLGTSRGQDRISVFLREGDGASGWISPNRIAFQESSVAPGGTATYSFWMANNSLAPGVYREYFQVVADGVGWMRDYGIYWDVTTKSGDAPPDPGYCLNMSNYRASPTINSFPYSLTASDEKTFSSPAREPSGLVYIPDYNSVFMVSDGGEVLRLSTDLEILNNWTVAGDLEGITYNPSTNKIYIAHEWPRQIDEYVYSSGDESFTFQQSWDLSGVISCSSSDSCIEALTFVPLDTAEGGVFYVGKQEDGTITVIELPLVTDPPFDPRTYGDSPVISSPSGITSDISGLHYNLSSGLVYAIFDGYDRMSTLQVSDNSWLRHFWLPSHTSSTLSQNEEGITFDSNCNLYIAEDTINSQSYGQVLRFD